jgi:hypothetical protein
MTPVAQSRYSLDDVKRMVAKLDPATMSAIVDEFTKYSGKHPGIHKEVAALHSGLKKLMADFMKKSPAIHPNLATPREMTQDEMDLMMVLVILLLF